MKRLKMIVFVPAENEQELRMAVGDAGGGVIGNYSHCAFVSKGIGYFKPLNGACPSIGCVGALEAVEEVKLEFETTTDKVAEIIKVIKKVHPYEEVPIDIFELLEVGDFS